MTGPSSMTTYCSTFLGTRWNTHIKDITQDFLKRNGQLLILDYLDFIQEPGHWGDELAVYLLAQMGNRAICVITKTGYWSTFEGGPEEANIVLVHLGCSIFHDTVPKAHKKVNKHEAVNELNNHELVNELNSHDDDPFKRHTRSMHCARIPISPSPDCPDEAVTKPKCK